MLSRGLSLPAPGAAASCSRPNSPAHLHSTSMPALLRQLGSQWTASAVDGIPYNRHPSGSARKLSITAAAGKAVSAAAAQVSVNPNSLRVIDTELHVEAERSYLAVGRAPLSPKALLCMKFVSVAMTICLTSSGLYAVCHVGDRGASFARCAGWSEAGPSPDPLCYARARHDVRQAAPEVRSCSWGGAREIPSTRGCGRVQCARPSSTGLLDAGSAGALRTAQRPSVCLAVAACVHGQDAAEQRRTDCMCRSTATATLDRWTTILQQPCDTRSVDCSH